MLPTPNYFGDTGSTMSAFIFCGIFHCETDSVSPLSTCYEISVKCLF